MDMCIVGGTGMAGREAAVLLWELEQKGRSYCTLTSVAGNTTQGQKYSEAFEQKERQLTDTYPDFWIPHTTPTSDIVVSAPVPDILASQAEVFLLAGGGELSKTLGPNLARRGKIVIDFSSAFRWCENIPSIVPEVNGRHLRWVRDQPWSGALISGPNCSTAGYVSVLHAMQQQGYRIEHVNVRTEQALSGKGDGITGEGYAEKARLHAEGFIDWEENYRNSGKNEEEWKTECEPQRLLRDIISLDELEYQRQLSLAGKPSHLLPIYAQNRRVLAQHGHLIHISIACEHTVNAHDIADLLRDYTLPRRLSELPSSPSKLFKIHQGIPPRALLGEGMTIHVGDIRNSSPTEFEIYTLTHNLRKGAAGVGLQTLELYLSEYR